jgi:hypothetical protein
VRATLAPPLHRGRHRNLAYSSAIQGIATRCAIFIRGSAAVNFPRAHRPKVFLRTIIILAMAGGLQTCLQSIRPKLTSAPAAEEQREREREGNRKNLLLSLRKKRLLRFCCVQKQWRLNWPFAGAKRVHEASF